MHPGGTPGTINSVSGTIVDNRSPVALFSYATDSVQIAVVFDEVLDSLSAAQTSYYQISGGVGYPAFVEVKPPLFDVVYLTLKTPIKKDVLYEVEYSGIKDCAGNVSAVARSIRTGLPSGVTKNIVINELLFNPPQDGADYVELFNAGENIVDANQLFISNNAVATPATNIYRCAEKTQLVFPGDYYTITEDTSWVNKQYEVKKDLLHAVSGLPSFPDDKGEAFLFNSAGVQLDAFSYSKELHYPLISNHEGVAIERIDPFESALLKENLFFSVGRCRLWHTHSY